MNSKNVYLVVLTWTLLSLGTARSQAYRTVPPPTYGTTSEVGKVMDAPAQPSEWILYRRTTDCCGPVGGHGPIQTELYLRTGLSFPIGHSVYGELLQTGWVIQGGARALFFDAPMSHAWFLDFGVSNVWNQERNRDTKVPLSVLVPNIFGQTERVNLGEGTVPGATVRDLNRTFVNLGAGRFWYLDDPTDPTSWQRRLGFDAGGRYGSGRARFEEIRAISDTMGGLWVGVQADLAVPCNGCLFIAGLRAEYSYTWTDVLQSNNADVEEINLLFHFGYRY